MHRHHQHVARHATHAVSGAPRRPDIVPRSRLPLLAPSPSLIPSDPPTLVQRDSSSSTCGASSCEKPTSTTTTTTLPVVLGAVVPIVCAIIVLIYLHRRNVKKLRNEDANDKHKSLDFGLDYVEPSGGRPMQQAEKGDRVNHMKGVSLDIGHPYLMPPDLQSPRDSLHSLSKSVVDDDKYRHASFIPADGASVRSHQRNPFDDASSLAGSSRHVLGEDMNQGLLGNAQRMSRSSPPMYNPPPVDRSTKSPVNNTQEQHVGLQLDLPRTISPGFATTAGGNEERHSAVSRASTDMTDFKRENEHMDTGLHRDSLSPEPLSPGRHSQNVPGLAVHDPLPTHSESHPEPALASSIPTPRISLPLSDVPSDYGDERKSVIPAVNIHGVDDVPDHDEPPIPTIPIPEEPQEENRSLDPRRDTRRLTFGLRPLPPEDPADNPEQRANRIRSFYKEYFEDSKPGARETVYEDYGADYYPDALYDPAMDYYSDVPAPFAEPVGRRAMTPPPRAPPRFQGAAGHMASGSVSGLSGFSSPRAFSSASNRLPGPPRAPRKPMPPPAPLNILPSPHLLKDDAIFMAADYAPGNNFKDQRDGRPGTPLGGTRPFSPMRAHTPLASAFDDLAVMPSPHALRKSGAFTNLDFAPPPRFKNVDSGSDSGSIRSVGTGISNVHLNNIRTGAYRVSRLPAETVGTKDDLMANLKPKWDMSS